MKKIMAICGSGLGTSFMVEMNINDILNAEGIAGYEALHSSLADATADQADIFVTAKDLATSATHLPNLIALDSLLDKEELRTKLLEAIK